MATNTKLTQDQAVLLIKGQSVRCPNCEKAVLVSRYGYKKQNVEYKCLACGEVYHPCKLI